jgi:hypothetical protein
MIVWDYAPGSQKSADKAWVPRDIVCPPGHLLPNGINAYPTFTVEVAKSNESYVRLGAEASQKYFSAMTGVMVYLGIKIFPTKQMKVIVGERNMTVGYGMVTITETGMIDITVPCVATVTIPTRLIYWGVPANQIPPNNPADYVLDLELVRATINAQWNW